MGRGVGGGEGVCVCQCAYVGTCRYTVDLHFHL